MTSTSVVNVGDVFYIKSIGNGNLIAPLLNNIPGNTGGSIAYNPDVQNVSIETGSGLANLGFNQDTSSGGLFMIANVMRWNSNSGSWVPITNGPVRYRDRFILRSRDIEAALRTNYNANDGNLTLLQWYQTIAYDMIVDGITFGYYENLVPTGITDVIALVQQNFVQKTLNPKGLQIAAASQTAISKYGADTSMQFYIQNMETGQSNSTNQISYDDQFTIVAVCDILGSISDQIGAEPNNTCSCNDELLPAWVVNPSGGYVVQLVQDFAIVRGAIHWDHEPKLLEGTSNNITCNGYTKYTGVLPVYVPSTVGGSTTPFTWSFQKYSFGSLDATTCDTSSIVKNSIANVCSAYPSQSGTDSACLDGTKFSACSLSTTGGTGCMAAKITESHQCFSEMYRWLIPTSNELIWFFSLPSGIWYMDSSGYMTQLTPPKVATDDGGMTDVVYGQQITTSWKQQVYVTIDGGVFYKDSSSKWQPATRFNVSTLNGVQGADQYTGPPDPYGGPRLAYARYPPMPGMTLPCVPASTSDTSPLDILQKNLCAPTDPTIGGLFKLGVQVKNWSTTTSIICTVGGTNYTVAPGATSVSIYAPPAVNGSIPYYNGFTIAASTTSTSPFYTQPTTGGNFILPSFRVDYTADQFSTKQPQDAIIDVDPTKQYVNGYYMVYKGNGSSNYDVVTYFQGLSASSSSSSAVYRQAHSDSKQVRMLLLVTVIVILGILALKKM